MTRSRLALAVSSLKRARAALIATALLLGTSTAAGAEADLAGGIYVIDAGSHDVLIEEEATIGTSYPALVFWLGRQFTYVIIFFSCPGIDPQGRTAENREAACRDDRRRSAAYGLPSVLPVVDGTWALANGRLTVATSYRLPFPQAENEMRQAIESAVAAGSPTLLDRPIDPRRLGEVRDRFLERYDPSFLPAAGVVTAVAEGDALTLEATGGRGPSRFTRYPTPVVSAAAYLIAVLNISGARYFRCALRATGNALASGGPNPGGQHDQLRASIDSMLEMVRISDELAAAMNSADARRRDAAPQILEDQQRAQEAFGRTAVAQAAAEGRLGALLGCPQADQ